MRNTTICSGRQRVNGLRYALTTVRSCRHPRHVHHPVGYCHRETAGLTLRDKQRLSDEAREQISAMLDAP